MIRPIAAVLLAALSAAAAAQAPANPPVRIRGTVQSLDGQILTVKARNGESMKVKLADNFVVMGITKASVDDIASGKFIGTTTVGSGKARWSPRKSTSFPRTCAAPGKGTTTGISGPTAR